LSVGEGEGDGVITVSYYGACKHQSFMPTVHDNVPGLMYSEKAVFTLSETACSEGQACSFALTTIQI
jgi:hypothetical protein